MTIHREALVTARKSHRCAGCLTTIEPGGFYLRWTGQYDDGTPTSAAYHLGCRRWEVRLCRLSDLMWDEWIDLHEHVAEGGPDVLLGAPRAVRLRFRERIQAEQVST